jgi:hypothetical protein
VVVVQAVVAGVVVVSGEGELHLELDLEVVSVEEAWVVV